MLFKFCFLNTICNICGYYFERQIVLSVFLIEIILSGEVLEWLKRLAWKACKPQKGFAGSNPALSAVFRNYIYFFITYFAIY